MPRFDTEKPITVELEVGVGDVRVTAGERPDTVVEVLPSNPDRPDDVLAAEQTRVEFAGGRLLIKAPKNWRRFTPFSDGGSIDVRIELPEGSELTGATAMGSLDATGRLGACRYTTGMGDLRLDEAGALVLRTGMGDLAIGHTRGDVDVKTGSGTIRIDGIDGNAQIKNSNGESRIGEAGGDLQVRSANGDITIGRAHGAVSAKTAQGHVRMVIEHGSVVAETGHGALEIGIAEGTAAFLDLSTGFGHVRSELGASEPPADGEHSAEVRARSGHGDITVRRA